MKDMLKEKCDRCHQPTHGMTIMSWFNQDIICMDCMSAESDLKKKLPNNGYDHEGCGYIPKVN